LKLLQISADFETALYARLELKVSADASLRVTAVPASGKYLRRDKWVFIV